MLVLIHLYLVAVIWLFANSNANIVVQNSTHLLSSEYEWSNSKHYFRGIPKTIKPTLKVLSLNNIRTTPELLLQALDGCTALETLELRSFEIASVENVEFNSTVYLPNLQSFKFSYSTKNELKNWNPGFESLAFFRKTNSAEAENVFNGNVDIDIQQGNLRITGGTQNEISMENVNGTFVDKVLCGLEPNFTTIFLKIGKLASKSKLECVNWSTIEYFSFNPESLVDSKSVLSKLATEAKNLKQVAIELDKKIVDPALLNTLKKIQLTNVTCKNTVVDLDLITTSLKEFKTNYCTFSKGNLDDFLKKASGLKYLYLDNLWDGSNWVLNLGKLPNTIRKVVLKSVHVQYDKTASNNLSQFQYLSMAFASILSFESKMPLSMKMFSLNNVKLDTSVEQLISKINGTNLEFFSLSRISERLKDDIQPNKHITIDLSKLNLPKVKTMGFGKVDLVESSPGTTQFRLLESLSFSVNNIIRGRLLSFIEAPIKQLYLRGSLEFVNTSFKDVFGRNEQIESIWIGDFSLPSFDLAEFPTKSLKKITTDYSDYIEIGNHDIDVKFDYLEKLDMGYLSSARGPNFLQSFCSMVSNAKNFSELKLEALKDRQSLNLSACFPIQNLNSLKAVDLSSLEIAEGAVFPKLTKLELSDDLEQLNKGLIDKITSVFPAALYMKLWTSNTVKAYNLVHKLITESCVQEFETELGRVNLNNTADADFDAKFNQVEKFLEEYGVKKNETVVEVFRSILPVKCNP